MSGHCLRAVRSKRTAHTRLGSLLNWDGCFCPNVFAASHRFRRSRPRLPRLYLLSLISYLLSSGRLTRRLLSRSKAARIGALRQERARVS